jgi:preprotein translocase subunit Sss1
MTCEELEAQRIEFQAEYDAAQQLLAAAQLVLAELVNPTPEELAAAIKAFAAAMSLVSAATSNLMYNYWNRMMNGCIPGGMSMSISNEKLKSLAEKIKARKAKK